jgi:hypothetical protein
MIQPTTTDIIKQIQTNPKDANTVVKSLLEPPSASKTTSLQTPLAKTLLEALSKNETSLTSASQTLKSSPWIKNAPLLAKELNNLVSVLKSDLSLKPLAKPFENILNTSLPDSKNSLEGLKTKLDNSGLHYEATLKEAISQKPISQNGELLLKNLLQSLPKAPLLSSFKEPLSNLIKELLQSPTQKSAQEFLKSFNLALSETKSFLNKNHPLLALLKNIEQLQDGLKNFNTNRFDTASFNKEIKNLFSNFNKALPILKEQNIAPQTIKSLKAAFEAIKNPAKDSYITKSISLHVNPRQNSGVTQNFNQQIQSIKTQQTVNLHAINTQLQPQVATFQGRDLQAKLSNAINKLKLIIQQADTLSPKLLKAFLKLENSQAQIKTLLTPLTDQTTIRESTIKDVKRLLLEVEQQSSNSKSLAAKEANSIAQKALAQLDFHQLYSYLSQQTHTYLPYFWDGLNSGAMEFKRDNEQTYCKINLEFEKYDRVQIFIALFNQQYIAITISVEHQELFERISSHLKTLRVMLKSAGLIPQNLTLLPTLQDDYESLAKEEGFGFDFKA